ncbi:NAD(P)H oxidoreductase RTN4IP1, mitochondrial-like [Arctopsyche grandis]|uniref:NAD(P)H oxidoreductase RTN4IP1, mitochondrial-like n=1 Tax=Arctopsyche grandis TaxID=121162 RepID=UPI00406D8AEF
MAPSFDELVFRTTERLDVLHMHAVSGANRAKEFAYQIHEILQQAWNNPALRDALERSAESIKSTGYRALESVQESWQRIGIDDLPSPAEIIRRLNVLFKDRMWRHTALIFVCGAACGSVFGIAVGWHWGSRSLAIPHYKALHSLQDGSAIVVEDGAGANILHGNDVVIKIHAFSIQTIDRDILRGRARRLRDLIKPRNKEVTIGRSFSGVITEMGSSVTRLDIGDEVWGALAEWEGGSAQEMLAAPAHRISRSPRALPPEAAASLPHCGSQALYHLQLSALTTHTAKSKRVLIVGAGIGAGCVIVQLLKTWGSDVVAVCDRRAQKLVAALGAQEVVTVDWCDGDGVNGGQDANLALAEALVQDLSTRERWDAAFICRAPKVLQMSMLKGLLAPTAIISDLRPKSLYTDKIGGFLSLFYGFYLNVRRTFTWMRGVHSDADFLLPNPLDSEMLDRLASHVEAGNLQTVVDKVYALKDFELALAHACSMGAIGCTVVRVS